MASNKIDINCDLGEQNLTEVPDQVRMLDFISSCNIATGFHAGDPATIFKTIQRAADREVAIGAHPSYPDKKRFGRVSMKMDQEELYASLSYQISALSGMCEMAGISLHHIKLHGALYHDAHHNMEMAEMVIKLIKSLRKSVSLYGLKNSILAEMAREADIRFYSEGFIDRRYGKDGRLLPRTESQATITDSKESQRQALEMIRNSRVAVGPNEYTAIEVDTLCIHSDHPGSMEIAQSLHQLLTRSNIVIKRPDLL